MAQTPPNKNVCLFLFDGLMLTVALVLVSYFWLDIPLVNWAVQHHLRDYTWLHYIQQIPEAFPILAFIVLVLLGFRRFWGPVGYHANVLLCAAVSFVISSFLVQTFKVIFARTWPATWINDNPSWISNGVYGFFWLTDSPAFKSFPSGHTTAIFAVCTVLFLFYKRLQWLCILACLLVVVGLIGNYYHFLSDIIAGAYLGTATGVLCREHFKKKLN
jgi:membrane-associated phospholipid phosphatase